MVAITTIVRAGRGLFVDCGYNRDSRGPRHSLEVGDDTAE